MTTKTHKNTMTETLTAIKRAHKGYGQAVRKTHSCQADLWTNTYHWVNMAIDRGRAKTQEEAFRLLLKALANDVSYSKVFNWYYSGKFVCEHKLITAKNRNNLGGVIQAHKSRGIMERRGGAPEQTFFKMVRNGATMVQVLEYVKKYRTPEDEAAVIMRRLRKSKQWNKTGMKRFLKSLKKVFSEFEKEPVEVGVFREDGEELMGSDS